MRSMIVMLDSGAPSFCYYEPAPPEESVRMTAAIFAQVITYAKNNDLSLNIVCGPDGIGEEQRALLAAEGVSYLWYVPAGGSMPATGEDRPSCIPVVNAGEPETIAQIQQGAHLTAILRATAQDLESLPEIWEGLATRVYRVVLVVLGLDRFDLDTLAVYEKTLRSMSDKLERAYLAGTEIELNAISDRMALGEPAHCLAGIDHITVAPDGQLHICPGFAVRDEPSVGGLQAGPNIPNGHLLALIRAPLCSLCDAYHCRRCVHLNQTSTLEVNTPPWQLCRASHLEREASRLLLDKLQSRGMLKALPPIEPIKYSDPLDAFLNVDKRIQAHVTIQPRLSKDASLKPRHQSSEQGACPLPLTGKRSPKGRISTDERDTVRELHLRKVALGDLFLSLLKVDRQELEQSPMYEELVREMGEVSIKLERWWEITAEKHGWIREQGRNWRIDFNDCHVYLDDPWNCPG